MSTVETLRAAREVLVTRGWTQRAFYDWETDGFCAEGAVAEALVPGYWPYWYRTGTASGALGDLWDERRAEINDALNALRAALGGVLAVPWFNDRAASVDEVLALFDKAIEALS